MSTERSFAAAARKIGRLRKKVGRSAETGVKRTAEDVLGDARVPRETGALAASGRVEGSGKDAKVTYGSDAVDYALAVHERRDVSHASGEARYLVRAVERLQGSSSRRRKIEEDVLQPVRRARP